MRLMLLAETEGHERYMAQKLTWFNWFVRRRKRINIFVLVKKRVKESA